MEKKDIGQKINSCAISLTLINSFMINVLLDKGIEDGWEYIAFIICTVLVIGITTYMLICSIRRMLIGIGICGKEKRIRKNLKNRL